MDPDTRWEYCDLSQDLESEYLAYGLVNTSDNYDLTLCQAPGTEECPSVNEASKAGNAVLGVVPFCCYYIGYAWFNSV